MTSKVVSKTLKKACSSRIPPIGCKMSKACQTSESHTGIQSALPTLQYSKCRTLTHNDLRFCRVPMTFSLPTRRTRFLVVENQVAESFGCLGQTVAIVQSSFLFRISSASLHISLARFAEEEFFDRSDFHADCTHALKLPLKILSCRFRLWHHGEVLVPLLQLDPLRLVS